MSASTVHAQGTRSQQRPSILLDWSRLLGFDQAMVSAPGRTPRLRLARVGTKVGFKPTSPAVGSISA